MLNLNGLLNMITFKNKAQRDSDKLAVASIPRHEVTVGDLADNPDRAEWTNCKFWMVINDHLVEVASAMYTGLILPNGEAQWAVFSNIQGVIVHQGYCFDSDIVYVMQPEYKPTRGAWEIYKGVSVN